MPVDQIGRASTSIVLNIAEGCGEFSAADRARFYRFARRSAAECAAVLDLLEEFEQFPADALEEGRVMLDRIMAMMTALLKLSLRKAEADKPRRSRREKVAPEP